MVKYYFFGKRQTVYTISEFSIIVFFAICFIYNKGFANEEGKIERESISNEKFSIKKSKKLNIALCGTPFIVNDSMTYAKFDNAEMHFSKAGNIKIFNVIDSENDMATFRREVVLWEDRLELTISIRQKPVARESGPRHIMYSLFMPADFFSATLSLFFIPSLLFYLDL
jgi:hypothetical protein